MQASQLAALRKLQREAGYQEARYVGIVLSMGGQRSDGHAERGVGPLETDGARRFADDGPVHVG